MYLIGIDISKFKHDCFIANETGLVIAESFSFDNNQEGFNKFLKLLLSLDQSEEIRIGLGGIYQIMKILITKSNQIVVTNIGHLNVKNNTIPSMRVFFSKKHKIL